MGETKLSDVEEDEAATKRGRQAEAKTYKKPTVYKIINQIKPVNTLLWGVVAQQYRVGCGELEARPATRDCQEVLQTEDVEFNAEPNGPVKWSPQICLREHLNVGTLDPHKLCSPQYYRLLV